MNLIKHRLRADDVFLRKKEVVTSDALMTSTTARDMRGLHPPCSAPVGKNAIAVIMADLNSSLTAMDWLPKLSVGSALNSTNTKVFNNNNDPSKEKSAFRKPPSSPLDPNATLDDDEAQQHKTRESKPPYSYANLITFAINSSPKKKMTLSEIYQWICEKFPFYKEAGNGWKVRNKRSKTYQIINHRLPMTP